MTLAQALRQLQALGLPRAEAHLLLLHQCGQPLHARAWLIAHDQQRLPAADWAAVQALAQRRLAGEPVAYLTGQKAFYGLNLHVDARVLDPRDDTETLVDWALEHLPAGRSARVIDLGTGSGAVALALASQRPQAHISATDASADALAVARANAQRLGLPLHLRQGHWWQAVPGQRFDLAVSNPPYIPEADPHLHALRHEPLSALHSGPDGLADLRQLIAQAGAHLQPGAWLLLEHGYDQAPAVRALLAAAGFAHISTRADLAGQPRCSGGQWPQAGA